MIYDVFRRREERLADAFFFLLMLLMPFERAFIDNGSGAFLQYFVAIFAMFAIFSWRNYFGKLHFAIVSYIIFLIIGTISDFREIGVYSTRILWDLLRAWIGCFLMIPAYNMARRSHSKSILIIYCLLFFAFVVAFCQMLGVGTESIGVERGVDGERISTLGANANGTARVVSVGILFAVLVMLGGLRLKSRFLMIIVYLLSIACFFALVRTGSRGGVFTCALAMLCLVFTFNGFSKKMACIFTVGMGILLLLFIILSNQMMIDRLNKAVFDGDSGGRTYVKEVCRYLWNEAKWTGYGCNVHKFILGNEVKTLVKATHNTYYYGFMSGGIIGAFFYYLSLGIIAIKAYRIRKYQYGNFLFLVMLLMLISGWVMNIENNKWLFVVYGVVLGMEEKIRVDIAADTPSLIREADGPRAAWDERKLARGM